MSNLTCGARWLFDKEEMERGGVCNHGVVHGRIPFDNGGTPTHDPRIPTMLGRNTQGFHRPVRHRVYQE